MHCVEQVPTQRGNSVCVTSRESSQGSVRRTVFVIIGSINTHFGRGVRADPGDKADPPKCVKAGQTDAHCSNKIPNETGDVLHCRRICLTARDATDFTIICQHYCDYHFFNLLLGHIQKCLIVIFVHCLEVTGCSGDFLYFVDDVSWSFIHGDQSFEDGTSCAAFLSCDAMGLNKRGDFYLAVLQACFADDLLQSASCRVVDPLFTAL